MLREYRFGSWIALLALSHASLGICSGSTPPGTHSQTPFFLRDDNVKAQNFSVGFSLLSSYGAAAIIFEGPHGKLNIYTQIYEAGQEYERIMAKLSLESSQHIAPPYDNDGQFWTDQPRQGARLALKLAGLPASYEVGVLAQVLKQLRSQLELRFGVVISEAVFTSSHLLALYQDDLKDAANYTGIEYVTPRNQFQPILWETATTYAGHGFGMCENWRDDDKCRKEEAQFSHETILAVHYSRNTLTVSLAIISPATSIWEPEYRHLENFTLGSDGMRNYASEAQYWLDVKAALLELMVEFPLFDRPEKILVTGDRTEGYFLEFLKKILEEFLGHASPIFSTAPMTVAARGAAEFMRRGAASWSGAD